MAVAGLIVGLGNPGKQYESTRHNMGFLFVDELLREARNVSSMSGDKFRCELWKASLPGSPDQWLIAKPQTFMNLSGDSVQPLMSWYRLSSRKLLVIHDELDLEPGRIKIKSGGGLAGHNGLKSIVQRLGTQDFYRLRLGVGRPPDRDNVISWVLGRFPAQEKTRAEESIKEAVEAILCFAADGPEKAANRYNGKKMASL